MTRIRISLWSLIATLTALWILANATLPDAFDFITIRNLLVNYSGVIAIGAMSVAMVLATRSGRLDTWLGGLDKSYRLHKWLGITALVAAISHWIATSGPKWLAGLGLLNPPARGARPAETAMSTIESLLSGLHDAAEGIAEPGFYALVVLIVLALVKLFPYRWFAKTHKLIAIAYLVLVFHSVFMLDFAVWTQPLGLVLGVLLTAGAVSAVMALIGRVGRGRQVGGTIETLRFLPDMKVLQTIVHMDDGWKGHKSGQFSFVTFDPREGQHPFTMASAWDPHDARITFITKGLGDHTNFLPEHLKVGDRVTVEGPYGHFTFDDDNKRQIWIAGGIGITPFIARMKQLAHVEDNRPIDLFHSTKTLAPEALATLRADATAANVTLHVLIDDVDGHLTGDKVRLAVPDWKTASVWFCGPAAFGEALSKDLHAHGQPRRAFHQELFNMR